MKSSQMGVCGLLCIFDMSKFGSSKLLPIRTCWNNKRMCVYLAKFINTEVNVSWLYIYPAPLEVICSGLFLTQDFVLDGWLKQLKMRQCCSLYLSIHSFKFPTLVQFHPSDPLRWFLPGIPAWFKASVEGNAKVCHLSRSPCARPPLPVSQLGYITHCFWLLCLWGLMEVWVPGGLRLL